MSFSLLPHRVYPTVLDIQGEDLSAAGITLLLADLDNTLAKYKALEPSPELRRWKASLEAAGVDLFILSNSKKPMRVERYAQALGVPFLGRAGKPGTGGFRRAMERMGRTPAQTAMVGDQIFTDILGARRAGVLPLMVEPIELKGNPGRYLRYAVEEPFRAIGRRRR